MSLLEILIAVIILFALFGRFVPNLKRKKGFVFLPFIAGILIPIQLVVDGYRWQMIPLYIFTIGLIIVSLVQIYQRSKAEFLIRNKIFRIICKLFFSLLFILSVIFPLLLPVVDLPKPAGPYQVGTKSFRMIDYERKEIFTKDSLDFRNLLVTSWYPANIEKGMPVHRYWDKKRITGKIFSTNADMGRFWYTHLSLVKTNSYPGAALSSERKSFPVIIYSPSFYGLNTENTMLFEELASNGYIIFSIAHSYETLVSIYPDGEVVPGNLEYISGLFNSHADKEKQLYQDYNKREQKEEKAALLKQILVVDELSNILIKTRRQDALFVLNEIEILNHSEGNYKTKLDLSRIGIMGWSFGGATAIEACLSDSRFKAGINIDGWPYGELFNSKDSINQPFMLIKSGSDDEMEDIISDIIIDKIENSAYQLSIKNTSHMNFWDFPLFFNVYKYIGYWGSIDPIRLLEIERKYIVGFFDQHLKGMEAELKEIPSNLFPELTFNIYRH